MAAVIPTAVADRASKIEVTKELPAQAAAECVNSTTRTAEGTVAARTIPTEPRHPTNCHPTAA